MDEENFDSDEIIKTTNDISYLINHALGNLNSQQMREVKARHEILVQQQIFWLSQKNTGRFGKDLKEYATWLCKHIADAEKNFWGNEETS